MNLNKTCALENLAQLIICVRELMHHSKVFLNSLIAARPGSIFTAGLMPGEAPATGQEQVTQNTRVFKSVSA